MLPQPQEARPGWVCRLEGRHCPSFQGGSLYTKQQTHTQTDGHYLLLLLEIIVWWLYLLLAMLCLFQPLQCQYYFILCSESTAVGRVCVCTRLITCSQSHHIFAAYTSHWDLIHSSIKWWFYLYSHSFLVKYECFRLLAVSLTEGFLCATGVEIYGECFSPLGPVRPRGLVQEKDQRLFRLLLLLFCVGEKKNK